MDTKYHLVLRHVEPNKYIGEWNTFYVSELKPGKLYLYVENGAADTFQAYPILADDRYRGTYASDFTKENDRIQFIDRRAGYTFKGELLENRIKMNLFLGGKMVSSALFQKSESDWPLGTTAKSPSTERGQPANRNDGLETGELNSIIHSSSYLDKMEDSIAANVLTHVHSILIANDGKLLYESYFNGFDADLLHDQRSAAKSIGSALVGIAMNDGILESVEDPIYKYIPDSYQYTRTDEKSLITLKHLLTMSSGLDAIDFGVDYMGQATEDNYQNTNDWLKTVLEAPMIYNPGLRCNYGSANPFLLGIALNAKLEVPLEEYMDQKLLAPLGITNYTIPEDHNGQPYFGGGMYLTPRDMMKFGELYRNQGNWNGKQLISKQWIEDSLKQYAKLENTSDKNEYGYLFWHHDYEVNGKSIKAVEARGAGGQIISIIDELDMTIVITSGNYRNGRYWQPQMIIEEYLLPGFVK
jgi:CubicO group peptidase (beta-lactamase class C family)